MTKKTKNKYNHYTKDFRRSDLPGASAVEVARELGMNRHQFARHFSAPEKSAE